MQIEKYWLLALVIACFTYESACKKASPQKSSPPVLESRAKMLKRADSMELATNYTAPSFDTMAYYASGYAKIMCSAVFVSKLDPLFAAYNVGGFVSPFESRSLMGTPIVDTVLKTVTITLPNGERRMAKYLGDHCQGCVSLPVGSNMVFYKPQKILPLIPDGENIDWPMGEKITESISPGINQLKINQALDAAFEGAGMTAAFVVTHKGKLIAERYGESINKNTPLESWSMGKSLTATLLGILIHQGYYALDQAAPIPEWQSPGDDRAKIKIDSREILEHYDLAHGWSRTEDGKWQQEANVKNALEPEVLFIERCVKMVKPGTGKCGIVLPDSILSNPGYAYVRYWILQNCQVMASVDLPVETFLPRTGTQTSVLILRRKSDQEKLMESMSGQMNPYDIFMANVKKVGKDRRGNFVYKKDEKGREIVNRELYKPFAESSILEFLPVVETTGRIVDDELPIVADMFKKAQK